MPQLTFVGFEIVFLIVLETPQTTVAGPHRQFGGADGMTMEIFFIGPSQFGGATE